ncbi:hypothetical protein L1887_11479 [Cichorium endivia]|nr:hypothetical protein L1887_11479 [Cichorium endivia]
MISGMTALRLHMLCEFKGEMHVVEDQIACEIMRIDNRVVKSLAPYMKGFMKLLTFALKIGAHIRRDLYIMAISRWRRRVMKFLVFVSWNKDGIRLRGKIFVAFFPYYRLIGCSKKPVSIRGAVIHKDNIEQYQVDHQDQRNERVSQLMKLTYTGGFYAHEAEVTKAMDDKIKQDQVKHHVQQYKLVSHMMELTYNGGFYAHDDELTNSPIESRCNEALAMWKCDKVIDLDDFENELIQLTPSNLLQRV